MSVYDISKSDIPAIRQNRQRSYYIVYFYFWKWGRRVGVEGRGFIICTNSGVTTVLDLDLHS